MVGPGSVGKTALLGGFAHNFVLKALAALNTMTNDMTTFRGAIIGPVRRRRGHFSRGHHTTAHGKHSSRRLWFSWSCGGNYYGLTATFYCLIDMFNFLHLTIPFHMTTLWSMRLTMTFFNRRDRNLHARLRTIVVGVGQRVQPRFTVLLLRVSM